MKQLAIIELLKAMNYLKYRQPIPIGHADGIGRQFGNGKGYVLMNNQKASIFWKCLYGYDYGRCY